MEWPRPRLKGKTKAIERPYQKLLHPLFKSRIGTIARDFFLRSFLYFLIALPGLFLITTVVGEVFVIFLGLSDGVQCEMLHYHKYLKILLFELQLLYTLQVRSYCSWAPWFIFSLRGKEKRGNLPRKKNRQVCLCKCGFHDGVSFKEGMLTIQCLRYR